MTDNDRRQALAYYAMVTLIDDQVGRILKSLDETGHGRYLGYLYV